MTTTYRITVPSLRRQYVGTVEGPDGKPLCQDAGWLALRASIHAADRGRVFRALVAEPEPGRCCLTDAAGTQWLVPLKGAVVQIESRRGRVAA